MNLFYDLPIELQDKITRMSVALTDYDNFKILIAEYHLLRNYNNLIYEKRAQNLVNNNIDTFLLCFEKYNTADEELTRLIDFAYNELDKIGKIINEN